MTQSSHGNEQTGGSRRRARYEQWVRDHSGSLYRLAYRLCGDAGTAEELVQETYYHAWKDMPKLRAPKRARAWLLQILRHRYAHWVRDQRRAPAPTDRVDGVVSNSPGPARFAAERDALQTALDRLEERFKLPLLLVFLEGLTCRDVAERLDLPLGTVLSRLHRGRQHLREALRQSGGELHDTPEQETQQTQPRLRLGGDT